MFAPPQLRRTAQGAQRWGGRWDWRHWAALGLLALLLRLASLALPSSAAREERCAHTPLSPSFPAVGAAVYPADLPALTAAYLPLLLRELTAGTRSADGVHRFDLAVCCVAAAKLELPYVVEFLLWHLLHGVQHFYVYEQLDPPPNFRQRRGNASLVGPILHPSHLQDNHSALYDRLRPLISLGLVSFHQVTGHHVDTQTTQVRHCYRRSHRRQVRWLADFDIDEFLFFVPTLVLQPSQWLTEPSLPRRLLLSFLDSFLPFNETVLLLDRWHYHGYGVWDNPPEVPVLQTVEHYMDREVPRGFMPKVIAYSPSLTDSHLHIHLLKPAAPFHMTDILHHHVQWHWPPPELSAPLPLRVNHLMTRSYSDCVRKRGNPQVATRWRGRIGDELCLTHYNGTNSSAVLRDPTLKVHWATESLRLLLLSYAHALEAAEGGGDWLASVPRGGEQASDVPPPVSLRR